MLGIGRGLLHRTAWSPLSAKGRTMNDARAKEQGLPHAVFLRRMVGPLPEGSRETRLGQGAFLALRLVDLLGPGRQPVHPDALRYQHVATGRYCEELPADCAETAHLQGLVAAAADAVRTRDARLVIPALLAYAQHLEDGLKLGEAFDVLETLVRVGRDRIGTADAITTRLRMARVLRKLNEFDTADDLYAEAGALASRASDGHAELLSRIGRAYTVFGRGNLREAEARLREILADAEIVGDRVVRAQAEQGIGVAMSTGGQPSEAIGHMWRAFELYEDDVSRTRALADLGMMLLTVGDADGAERALTEVVRRGGTGDAVHNALIELMHCASYRRDRVGFERWRVRCESAREEMPPNILADFYLKSAIGRARFGQFEQAETLLDTALEIAEDAGLNEFVFRIERIKNGLRDCQRELEIGSEAAAEPVLQSETVREVSASLTQLG